MRTDVSGNPPARPFGDVLRQAVMGPRTTRWRHLRAAGFAAIVTLATLGLRRLLDPVLVDQPTLTLLVLPILLSSYVGGVRSGLVATAVAVFGNAWFLQAPLHSFAVESVSIRWGLGFLALVGVTVSLVSESLHRARRRAGDANVRAQDAHAGVRDSEARYRLLFELAPDGLLIADPQSVYLDANARICAMLGYTRQELVGLGASDIVVPAEAPHVAGALAEIAARGAHDREWRFRRKDGSTFAADVQVSLLPDGNLIAVIRDITERQRAEARILGLNRLYAVLSAINALIVRTRDPPSLFEGACRIAADKGGFPLVWLATLRDGQPEVPFAVWIGQTGPFRAAVEDTVRRGGLKPALVDLMRRKEPLIVNDIAADARLGTRDAALAGGLRSLVVLPLCANHEVVAFLGIGAAQVDAFDADEMGLLRQLADDISFALDHQRTADRLAYLAYHDELTGLANRALLHERLAQTLHAGGGPNDRTALVLLDIERFKNINDSLGRPTADELLRQVAAWLQQAAGDALQVARVGPDRFALLLPQFHHDAEAARFVSRIARGFLEHRFRLKGTDYRIAAKFGAALAPEDGADAETLFLHAEAALKKAKAVGERSLFYTQQMTTAMAHRMAMESRLRHALDNGEFVLHYQPKIDLRSGLLVGAEALIRWNDPTTGLVPPGDFIPVLEETGLIDEVGRWALGQAIADQGRWRARSFAPVQTAVNVSPLQLRNPAFVDDVRRAVAASPADAGWLELEITESMIMEDVGHSIASLARLRELGIAIAIDDFGTGFSSLASLAKLPVDTLKIDRVFVADVAGSANGLAIVSTMVGLAHSLGLVVVAEGVETEEQARLLTGLGCDQMQGFLCSRPLPRDVFETAFLASGGTVRAYGAAPAPATAATVAPRREGE